MNYVADEPLVSILMLTYNRAHFLPEAVSSVLAQSYKNFELIIIDDGSTDTTPAAVADFTDERIRYIRHEQNKGLHARRRESLTYVTGTYVAVLDSDDSWHDSEKLARQVSFLEEHSEHVLVGTFTKLIDARGQFLKEDRFEVDDQHIRKTILTRNQFTHSAVLIRSEALAKTNGYQPTLAEDLEIFLQLGTVGKFANLPAFLTSHRIHENSENDRGINMASAVHEIIKKHRYNYPNFVHALIKSYGRLCKSKLHL